MGTQKNLNQVGWMYHAPAKQPNGAAPAPAPPASQIPGLNDFPEGYFEPEEPKGMRINENDSAYIRLAKQGGRPDLLRQRTPKDAPTEAKAYPRVDWYYQDDIKMENDIGMPVETPEEYQFALPEYMVHQAYKPHGDLPEEQQRRRNFLSRDETNVFQREGGRHATDKTVRIEEARAQGYGVRQEKRADKIHKMPAAQPFTKAGPPHSEMESPYANLRKMALPKEDERIPMSKLLSFGYAREWEDSRDEWENKNYRNIPGHRDEDTKKGYHTQSAMPNGAEKIPRVPSHGRRAPQSNGSSAHSTRRQRSHADEEKPDFFSLTKISANSPRTDSRRMRSELQPAMLMKQK